VVESGASSSEGRLGGRAAALSKPLSIWMSTRAQSQPTLNRSVEPAQPSPRYKEGVIAAVLASAALALAPLPGFVRIATGPDGGSVWEGRIVPSPRPSIVYLPPGYTRSQRYPVVYLLHGMPGDPYGFVGALRLAGQADQLAASGARPFIAVAPPGGSDARYRGEWAGAWEDHVVRTVVPWVDRHLPTIASPRGRTIGGLSAGGFGALDIALRHPGLFGTIESWGGYYTPFRDGPLRDATRAQLDAHDPALLVRREAPALRREGVRFFLSSGPTHGHILESETPAFGRALARLRLPHTVWLVPAGILTADWRAQLRQGLRYAFAPATS